RGCGQVAQVGEPRRWLVASLCAENTCAVTCRPRPLGPTGPSGRSAAGDNSQLVWTARWDNNVIPPLGCLRRQVSLGVALLAPACLGQVTFVGFQREITAQQSGPNQDGKKLC